MSTPRCNRCKFWAREEPPKNPSPGLDDIRRCNRPLMFWDATEWIESDDLSIDRALAPQNANDLMFVQDGSDYHAELLTKPAFFCAHFEEQP